MKLKKIQIRNFKLYHSDFSLLSNCKIFFLVLAGIHTMQPYFFWGKDILLVLFSLCAALCWFIQFSLNKNYNKKKFNINTKNSFCLIIVFFLYWHIFKLFTLDLNIFGIFGKFFLWLIPVIIFILSTDEERKQFLNIFSNVTALILLISFLAYLLVLIGIKLPSTKIYNPNNANYAYFTNYRFFIVVYDKRSINLIMRFQSIFTEPGHLSMMAALLLYANEYKFNKIKNLIYLISLIFTLSLAGYILLPAGMFIYYFSKSRKKVLMFIILSFLGFLGITFGIIHYSKHPDSIVSQLIISRLMPDKEKGFTGNNRNSARFKIAYKEFIDKGDLVTVTGWGNSMKKDFPEGHNSSYKNFIYENGIFGFFLLWLMYLTFINKKKRNTEIGLLLLFMISFIQRPYAIWLSQMFIFLGYCSTNKLNNK